MNKNLTPAFKAYFAGFVDGEGCINITKSRNKKSKTPYFALQVHITQNNEDFLRWACSVFELGSVSQRSKQSNSFDWRMTSNDALAFLKIIYPYLFLKREEAKIAIEFQERFQGYRGEGIGWTVPDEIVKEKESYLTRLQDLKGKSGKNGGRGRPTL